MTTKFVQGVQRSKQKKNSTLSYRQTSFFLFLITVILCFFLLVMNSTWAQSRKDQPQPPSQVRDVLRQLPNGLLNLPFEAFYRLLREFHLDGWSFLRKDQEIIKLLELTKNKNLPKSAHTFPFENFDEDFKEVSQRDFGVCSGFATLQRNFNILLHFDPKNEAQQNVPFIIKREEYLKFYTELLTRASEGFPVIIPYMNNLKQLMTDPDIQLFTKKLIIKKWAENNTSLQGIEQFLKHKKRLSRDKFESLHQTISERLKSGYNPIIYSSFPSTQDIKFNIHVVQVVDISAFDPISKTFDLWVWDDGVMKDFFGPFLAEKLLKVISFRKDGQILWLEDPSFLNLPLDEGNDNKRIAELKKNVLIDDTLMIGLLPNDDHVMADLALKKLYWCSKNTHSFCDDLKK